MKNLPNLYGSMVFNESIMQERLPTATYKALKKTINNGKSLDLKIANVVANAMKDWAIEKGVTHFTHWFQPMTGITAEKHESFISPVGEGKIIMEFSGKELIKGEPDASSFPSGGIRATFEARGYTAWDPTSYAFIKDNTLCIPTAFCSYSGEVLDKKTPLLRSMDTLNKQSLRVLKFFDNNATRVTSVVGAEQEYFLINKALFEKRKDLIFTGRTLFGCNPPKGQELDDHYFGAIKDKVANYMKELDEELWKMGVPSKTKHNEVAPSQHELAPIYETANLATDHNQLIMETMKKVAIRNDLACLLHEKPFAGINGSGKHNNWSITTDTGENLLNPGKSPYENKQFLLFLTAVIKAVDEYQDLLRLSVANAGNDHRLGANEAPPAIISVYLGKELTNIVNSLISGDNYNKTEDEELKTGIDMLPSFSKDNSDRNRTSPFAFTGNKFEFRMLGSTFSVSGPNIVLNTIVAEILDEFATQLESAVDFKNEVDIIISENLKKHSRIIFNGNNYSNQWLVEAEKRGLLNLKSTPEALQSFISDKNIKLFAKHKIFNETEVRSRYEILMENYCKTINIEALTTINMAKKDIIPAVQKYIKSLAETANQKKSLSCDLSIELEIEQLKNLSSLNAELYKNTNELEKALSKINEDDDIAKIADYYRNTIFEKMQEVRKAADSLESMTDSKYWPFPCYEEILFSV